MRKPDKKVWVNIAKDDPKLPALQRELPNHVLYDVTYPDKAVDFNARLFYESASYNQKVTARLFVNKP